MCDYLGVKLFFYIERNDSIIFGFEIKVLLVYLFVFVEIDVDGINEIFGLGLF